MNKKANTSVRSLTGRLTRTLRHCEHVWAVILTLLVVVPWAPAASFFADFNSGLPAGTAIYGNSTILANTGYTNSGCLLLTSNLLSQTAGFVITSDLDAGNPVYGFVAQFKAFIGGGSGADGISFNFANDLLLGAITEDGAGSGLRVEFDTYSNDASDDIGVDLWVGGSDVVQGPFSGLRQNTWVDVLVLCNPDGTASVMYDGTWIYTNFSVASYGFPSSTTGGLFGFGGRTGGSTDTQAIDNLSITTFTTQGPFVSYYYPVGRAVRPDAPIQILLTDFNTQVNTNKIVLKLDGAVIVPTVVTQAPPVTTVLYLPPPSGFYASGSSHTVSLSFADKGATPVTNTVQYGFTVGAFTVLTNNAPPSLVSTKPGFDLRISQIDANLGPTIQRAENQLANLLIDPGTGLPYVNEATVTSYIETNVINYSTAGAQGDFPTEGANSIPGLPGQFPDTSSSGDTNVALDVVTYLYLPVGIHTLGVNSSDGFRLTAASNPDVFSAQEAVYDGVRAAADTTVTFGVTNAGYYPFRLVYFVGGLELVNPTTDNPSLEFFSVDAFGNKTLINDTNVAGYTAAYQPAVSLPYIRSVTPAPASAGVPHTSAIGATLVDGSISVRTNTFNLWLNGAAVSPIITSNAGITTVSYQPSPSLSLNSSNWVQLAFTDSASNRRTNQWSFIVENVLQQLWVIPPASGTNATWAEWVTTGSTERGVAYNPKTGHVLLVSRSAVSGGPGAKGGIAILDGSSGAFLGTMDVSLSTASGVGTYILDMIGVAEDGVIYACNLTTSGTTAFQIYRWQNESAPQQLIWNQNPLGGATRCGDDFRVQGSGAGTRIIASGNSTVSTIPIFTTVDGTNFTGTAISVSGLGTLPSGGFFRLGLAFGCGDTFYGQNIGSPTVYCSFSVPSGAGTTLATYPIVAYDATASIGPIGVDIINQRLIGDETSGGSGTTHSMNLYDISMFTPSGNNSPIDHKVFATSTGSFGTGSVDFTPDGTRVYTLDTANGIIAFSLSPRVAAPTICSQPRTNIVAGIGSVGFMDVRAIGAPQSYQWRFNATNPTTPGTPILNATNRTLDIYNVRPGQLGFYSVVISNSTLLTSVTSSVAVLDTQMVITNQPASQVVAVGGNATFTVGVSNGAAPYSYQWKLNGANVGPNSSSYTVSGAQVANAGGYTVVVTDALGQSVTSAQAGLTVGTLGTGTGLIGDYYSSQAKTFVDPPTLERLDSTVNFDWGAGSPDPSISADTFTVRWTGLVQPLYSQTYTFYTATDDGARLWVNGQQLVNQWVDQAFTEWSGTIALTAYQKYPILMEYYENTGNAAAVLSWSSTGQAKGVIPQTQLYPVNLYANGVQPSVARSADGSQFTISWSGSYVLESASSLNGPWTIITGSASPYVVTIDSAQHEVFYRLVSQ